MKQAEQRRDTRLESQQPPLPPAKPHVLKPDAAERQRQHAEYQHRLHVADAFPDSAHDFPEPVLALSFGKGDRGRNGLFDTGLDELRAVTAYLPEFGVRFPDASKLYTPALRDVARKAAQSLSIPLREGVYMYFPGPQYETPAEVRAARILGADAVGMSTAPEVITAGHCGMRVLGFTLLSNMAAGILDQPLTEEEVFAAAAEAKDRFSKLILACLEAL